MTSRSELNLRCVAFKIVATSSVLLASKIKEEAIRLRDLINVAYRELHRDEGPPKISSTYGELKAEVSKCDLLLARTIKYGFALEDPYKYLLHYLKLLANWHEDDGRGSRFPCTCHLLLGDVDYTSLPMRLSAPAIASVVIFTGLKLVGYDLPEVEDAASLCAILCPGISEDQLVEASTELLQLYLDDDSRHVKD